MDNEKQHGQHSGEQNPTQKDPQREKDNQQRQGGTQQDQQRRQPESNPANAGHDREKDKKTA
jgi:hypothetical protein